ncbi:hypothetical protein J3Q64DRAFT_1667905 [Phycomyces blakesleeanus]|uniref:Uncharacterized protein n=1 Tax=Phycomyces blakesleeanus TaxID=4837 RepID=A0ABR3AJQ4_PHYBL
MVVRTGKPTRRHVIPLLAITILACLSWLHLRNIQDESSSLGDNSLEYTKPSRHQDDSLQDGIVSVDRAQGDSLDRDEAMRLVNQKYCGQDTCRFILPIVITEQESKAQEHFRQIAYLSGFVNRTIVLPNVHTSHLGACRRKPFSFYYSYSWLNKNQHAFGYISMRNFNMWLKERNELDRSPVGQEVYLESNGNPNYLDLPNCFKNHMFIDRPESHFYLEDPEQFEKRQGNYTQLLTAALSDEARNQDYINHFGMTEDKPPVVDVIQLYYDRRFSFIEDPRADEPLSYSDTWTSLADKIAEQLEPFVAVHWRMERLSPLDNMILCAATSSSLISKSKSKSKSKQSLYSSSDASETVIPNVFLLTDYPHLLTTSKAQPESMSFKLYQLAPEHHQAVKYVYERLNVTLTTLDQGPDSIPYDELPAQNWNILPIPPYADPVDTSILGIIDKLIAMRAQWFLAGEPGVCGKPSSFTRRIVIERQMLYDAGDRKIILPEATFDLPDTEED